MGASDDPMQSAVKTKDLIEELDILLRARCTLETQLCGQAVALFYHCVTQRCIFLVEEAEKGCDLRAVILA